MDPVAVVQTCIAAWNAHDLDAALACSAPHSRCTGSGRDALHHSPTTGTAALPAARRVRPRATESAHAAAPSAATSARLRSSDAGGAAGAPPARGPTKTEAA